jgi:hypothetical protein
MPTLVFRGERSVEDLSARLYSRLTARQKEKVVARLLEDNPQLANLRDLPAGAVLHVEDLPELRAKRRPDREKPELAEHAGLAAAVEAFGSEYARRVDAARKQVTDQKAVLRSTAFKKAWEAGNQDRAQTRSVLQALDDRAERLTKRRRAVQKALRELMKQLEN